MIGGGTFFYASVVHLVPRVSYICIFVSIFVRLDREISMPCKRSHPTYKDEIVSR
jgi:hypothetical protein